MAIDRNHPDYIDLRSRIRENPKEFVAIVGAGLSRPCGLPSWSELRDFLIENARDRKFEIPDEEQEGYLNKLDRISKNDDLWYCFSELEMILPTHAYRQCITDKLSIKDKNQIPNSYKFLWQLNIKGIVTYNIDSCAIDSYAKTYHCSVDTATNKDTVRFSQFIVGSQQFVFQPHGFIKDPSTWVFTVDARTNLLISSAYKEFMQSLCQTKHLFILGYDTTDFAFNYLVQSAITVTGTTNSKHYLLLPRRDPGLIKIWSNKGFVVIPYEPRDPIFHHEVEETLSDFLSFSPKDDIPATVFIGAQRDLSDLPKDDELITMPVHKARQYLNSAVAGIIPPDKTPSDEDIDKLEEFYRDHLKAIHMAWLIEPDSEYDVVHGYKIIDTKERGAFGQVYEAEHMDTKKRVALKVLLPEVRKDREYLNSFRRGVRSMRILTKQKVEKMVALIDAFEVPACIVMEYIDGPTLSQAKKRNLLYSLDRCLDVLVQIGEVVH